MEDGPGAQIEFDGDVIQWRGPAPFLFVPVPEDLADDIRFAARTASYGWGCVPVSAQIGATAFTTSLFPRNGTYLLPVKVTVQRSEEIELGDRVGVRMQVLLR